MVEYLKRFVIVIIIMLCSTCSVESSGALSPSFPSTQIMDPRADTLSTVRFLGGHYGCRINSNMLQDMSGVTYASDGKYLNATIWLKNPIKNIINPLSAEGNEAVIYHLYPDNTFVNVAHGQKKALESYLKDFNSSIATISLKQIVDSHNKSSDLYKYSYSIGAPHSHNFKRYGFKIISDLNNDEG